MTLLSHCFAASSLSCPSDLDIALSPHDRYSALCIRLFGKDFSTRPSLPPKTARQQPQLDEAALADAEDAARAAASASASGAADVELRAENEEALPAEEDEEEEVKAEEEALEAEVKEEGQDL